MSEIYKTIAEGYEQLAAAFRSLASAEDQQNKEVATVAICYGDYTAWASVATETESTGRGTASTEKIAFSLILQQFFSEPCFPEATP